MKLFGKTKNDVPACLFKKHGIQAGKILVESLSYWETTNVINVCFKIIADGMEHSFSTRVPYNGSETENYLMDAAFNNIQAQLASWLSVSKSFKTLKTNLLGKVVFEWDAADNS